MTPSYSLHNNLHFMYKSTYEIKVTKYEVIE